MTAAFEPSDPGFEARVRESFHRQKVMRLSVLTVEYKMNLVAPVLGEKLIATGRVIKPGRTLTICELEVKAVKDGRGKLCAHGLQTLMCVKDRPDIHRAG
jgi:acyl-coenzyme A thioesterase PaaI-like protein